MCVLVPLNAWCVFIAGLLVGEGTAIPDKSVAIQVFMCSIPYNFYAILAVAMVGLFASGILPEYGPMRRAEDRALNQGRVLADGAISMMAVELSDIEPAKQIKKPNLLLNFALPLSIVVVMALGSFVYTSLYSETITVMILEAFMTASLVLGVILWLQRVPMREVVGVAMQGVKGVMPAVVLLALAFSIKLICDDLGTAQYVIAVTRGWMTPTLLPLLAFGVCAFVSFSTGTSWGTYITIPIFVPIALEFGGGEISPILHATLAAVTGVGLPALGSGRGRLGEARDHRRSNAHRPTLRQAQRASRQAREPGLQVFRPPARQAEYQADTLALPVVEGRLRLRGLGADHVDLPGPGRGRLRRMGRFEPKRVFQSQSDRKNHRPLQTSQASGLPRNQAPMPLGLPAGPLPLF